MGDAIGAPGSSRQMWSPEQLGNRTQMLDEDPFAIDDDGVASAQAAALEAASGELMSHNTAANIVKNKYNINYCVDQFQFISNRIKCIKMMTGGGPFLA